MPLNSDQGVSVSCPDAVVCGTCPCAAEDDACFPGERLRAERDYWAKTCIEWADSHVDLAGRASRYRGALEEILAIPSSRQRGEGRDRVTQIVSMREAHAIARTALDEEAER